MNRARMQMAKSQALGARGYVVVSPDGGEYSADAGDYWSAADSDSLGGALVKQRHRYLTVSGRVVYAPRFVVFDATVGHLRRLDRAAWRMVSA